MEQKRYGQSSFRSGGVKGFLLALSLGAVACSPKGTHNPAKNNEAIVRRYFGEVWNGGKLGVLDELLAPQYINRTPSTPDPPPGPEGLKPIVAAIRKGIPDLHYEIKDIIATDSMAVARVVVTGTHTDTLFDLPPTGRKFTINQVNIEKIRDGKIVEHWRVTEELQMMQQLGVVQ